ELVISSPQTTPCCEISILLGNGDGTFRARSYSTDYEGALAASDFNSDGKADLVVAMPGNQVRLLLGRGDGSFEPGTDLDVAAVGAARWPQSIAVSDVNSDGFPDVIVANVYGAGTVYLANGDGTFQ